MDRVYILDVDGTLTPSRRMMVEDFLEFFNGWSKRNSFWLVSGSDLDKIKEQVPEYILELADGLFTCCGNQFYKDVIGVTVSNSRPQRIQFWIDKKNAPYVITKPFHKSQRLIKHTDDGVIFNIFVQINYELERMILGFGDSIEVIKPDKLRNRILGKLQMAVKNY